MTEATASKISQRAMSAAVDMELHGAIGSITKDKAACIQGHFPNYDELLLALTRIAETEDENDEWDGRDRFRDCRETAREALSDLSRAAS